MKDRGIFLVNASGHSLNALHLGYIAALLRNNGINFKVIDFEVKSLLPKFEKEIQEFKPGIVAIISGLMNPCLNVQGEGMALELVQIAKKNAPPPAIIKDGISSTVFTKEALRSGMCDIAIIGESDFAFLDIIRSLINNQRLETVKGIAFMKDGKIIKTPPRKLLKDLDALPFPARDILDQRHFKKEPWHFVVTSRGCPFPCTICQPVTRNIFGLKTRRRKPSGVVDEIEEVLHNYGEVPLQFWGDTFTDNRKWVIQLCDEILKRNLKFKWLVGTRVDCIDFDLAKRMKEAGCYEIGYGVEASNDELRNKLVKKGTSLRSIYQAIEINKRLGIINRLAFLTGLPTRSLRQTLDNLIGNIRLIIKARPEWILVANTCPIPGLELYDIALRRGILNLPNKWKLDVGNFYKSYFKNVSVLRIGIEYISLILIWLLSNPASVVRIFRNRWKRWRRK